MKPRKKNRGLTLIEILVASALGLMVIAMIYSLYASGNDLWEIKRYQTDLQAQGRQIMQSLMTELRKTTRTSAQVPSPNLIIPLSPNNNNITFYLPQTNNGTVATNATTGAIVWQLANPVVYLYDATNQQVLRREAVDPSGNRTIGNDVTNIQFIDNKIDGSLYLNELKIILSLLTKTPRQRTIAMTFSSIVRLRN